ncbi:MAG: ATP-binding protein, partial [Acidobacteriota bacterium]
DARRFVLADTGVSLAVSAAVGLFLAATLSRRIRRLTSATRRVASGDLDARVEDPRDDELAHLAEHFDHMVGSLREQREALEQRHAQLRSSLDEQRRLTEDLIQRKASEELAERARAEAEARDSAKSLFLATMSHELRTPLNAILGFAQILTLESRVRGEARMEEDLRRIDAAGKHLLTLIDNILDFSKIEQGEMDVDLVDLSLDDLAQEVVAIVGPLARERGDRLRLEIADSVGQIRSDPAKLRQILFNLLSNAVKFTEAGDVVLAICRHDGLDDAPDRIEIEVRDTGIGIAEEHLDMIFEPFRQAESSTARRFGGTGLGLVVSRQLSDLLGGSIEVESELGVGSTFTVHLPAEPPAVFDGTRSGAVAFLPSPRTRSQEVP